MFCLIRIFPFLVFYFAFSLFTSKGQIIDPWSSKVVYFGENKIDTREGIFEGYRVKYGVYCHKPNVDHYKALPFIYIPANKNPLAPLMVVFNGGPGSTNMSIIPHADSLLNRFSILLVGYRGVDDNFSDIQHTVNEVRKHVPDDIRSISKDVLNIVEYFQNDTIFVVGHSFGTVYACDFLAYKSRFNCIRSVFFSPMFTRNLYEISSIMENMVADYFKDSVDSSILYQDIVKQVAESDIPENTAMGLILYLSEIKNFKKLYDALKNKKSIVSYCMDGYRQHQEHILMSDQISKFSLFFKDDKTKNICLGQIGEAIYHYFQDRISVNSLSSSALLECEPDVIFVAQYDFSDKRNATIVNGASHSSLWNDAYKFIIEFAKKK